jgi:dTDP-4-amino-4,6-dideoxygalactose transaminase
MMMQQSEEWKPVRSADRFLVFGQPLIEEEDIAEVVASLRAAWPGTGPKAKKFEALLAEYKGVKHAIALNSCTSGLHLSCIVNGLEPGDEVITTPLTFCATVNAIIHAGGTPVLADVDPRTQNIDPAEVRRRITPRTKLILPVHLAGRACEMAELMSIAREHNLRVVEDCAHAIETTYHGRPVGTFGNCGVLSFYSTKNVVTGEGGMVLTNDDALAARIRCLSQQGMSQDAWKRFSSSGYKHYEVAEVGFKYNMPDIQAALGIHQMGRLERSWLRRQEIWNRYDEAFAGLPVECPAPPAPGTRHAYHLFTLLVDEEQCGVSRDEFIMRLQSDNIGVGVHYRQVAAHPVYQQRYGWKPEEWPHAERISETTVSLPLSAKLTDADAADVIEGVQRALAHAKPRKRSLAVTAGAK